MKNFFLVRIIALALPATLAACAVIPDAPIVANGPAQPEGTAVPLRMPVEVGDVVVTPMRVTEDSRCPINARCVWAGRIIVESRVDGAGWRDTVPVTLGETVAVRDHVIALVSAEPGTIAGQETDPARYRFVYEARN